MPKKQVAVSEKYEVDCLLSKAYSDPYQLPKGFPFTGPAFSNLYLVKAAYVGNLGSTIVIVVAVEVLTDAFYPHTNTKLSAAVVLNPLPETATYLPPIQLESTGDPVTVGLVVVVTLSFCVVKKNPYDPRGLIQYSPTDIPVKTRLLLEIVL